ncbi:MAG: thioredoxin domain-containing protein [Oscillospiraceae bacterium]|nr:thioredoxin domain-containing protein [Oscillospiraceae bacterium]
MNRLLNETSPYLLQHAENPVDWYPWGEEAFKKAKAEDKPVLLSVGYSTCHWCHVMAHESFEDLKVAEVLNREYVCVKVDKEERPDIDSIYMNVLTALTGSGGWPMTIIMDAAGNPFFAGTYFPKTGRYGIPGFIDLLEAVTEKWKTQKNDLIHSAQRITSHINARNEQGKDGVSSENHGGSLCENAVEYFKSAYDSKYGGFGGAPKFPSPHNLLFLMSYYKTAKDKDCLAMVEKTLEQMAKGGIFDHIGFGFSRYSTDDQWLVPHFEKMLYDNALLITAYTSAYEVTKNPLYKNVAEKIILYVKREMTHPDGGFYSAQDADSDGVEGKYYVFTPNEIVAALGEKEGNAFNEAYDITKRGNFEGKSIPNRINAPVFDAGFLDAKNKLYEYRKTRAALHKDDKILTAWNALMIPALSCASVVFGESGYLHMAEKAVDFIEKNLSENKSLLASWRDGRRSESGFLDDYAFYIYAQLKMYQATIDDRYLDRAKTLAQTAIADYFDNEDGGFFLSPKGGEELISRPKESYDGAMPSGNSVMAMNLILLHFLTGGREWEHALNKQIRFMNAQAGGVLGGHSFYLLSLLQKDFPGRKIIAVPADPSEKESVRLQLSGKGWAVILDRETDEYKRKDGKTTFYICENHVCRPPVNELD